MAQNKARSLSLLNHHVLEYLREALFMRELRHLCDEIAASHERSPPK